MPADPPPDAQLRPYDPSDADAIVEVWRAASELATPFLSADFLEQEARNIRDIYLPVAESWVASGVDGTVEGFLSLLGDEVGAIFVRPEAQGSGFGRALMDHAVSLRGSVFLDVFEANAVGRRFYERYGFSFERAHVHEASGHQLLRLRYP